MIGHLLLRIRRLLGTIEDKSITVTTEEVETAVKKQDW
jgi:hypothetical protein